MANTKLDSYQKQDRKEMKQAAKNEGVQLLVLNNQTVMAFKPRGNTVEFALAVMSPDEEKFRLKVGEYFALLKFEQGMTVRMATADFECMSECVWDSYPL